MLVNPLNKHFLRYGHFETQAMSLLPFPDQCCDLAPRDPAALDRMAEIQHEKERRSILGMLSALGIDPAHCPAITRLLNGYIQVNSRLLTGNTADLPPTASKPDAVYNPAALYADPVPPIEDASVWPFGSEN